MNQWCNPRLAHDTDGFTPHELTAYRCNARPPSVLRGHRLVRANGYWPAGRNGNLLVADVDQDYRLFVVQVHNLRRINP